MPKFIQKIVQMTMKDEIKSVFESQLYWVYKTMAKVRALEDLFSSPVVE